MDDHEQTIIILTMTGKREALVSKVRLDPAVAEAFQTIVETMTANDSLAPREGRDRTNTNAIFSLLSDPATLAELADYSEAERIAIVAEFGRVVIEPKAWLPWSPVEKWRSKHKHESAREFIKRVYLALPYDKRPYTHQLANKETGDRPIYDVCTMIVAHNRKHGLVGPAGSLEAARSLRDIFPMVGNINKPKPNIIRPR